MRIEFIKFSNKKPEKMLMKHLRENEQRKQRGKIVNFKSIADYFNGRKNNIQKFDTGKRIKINNIRRFDSGKRTEINNIRRFSSGKRIEINKNRVALVAVSLMLVTASYWNYLNRTKFKIAQIGDATFVSANAIIGKDNSHENNIDENISKDDVDSMKANVEENNTDSENANKDVKEDKESKQVNSDEANVNSENENIEEKNSVENLQTNAEENANDEISEKTSEVANSNTKNEIESKNYFTKLRLDREKTFSQMIDNYNGILEKNNISDDQKKFATDEIKAINDNQNAITTIENLLKGKGFEDAVVLINDNSTNVVVKSSNELSEEQVAQIENIVSRELNTEIEKIHITTHN